MAAAQERSTEFERQFQSVTVCSLCDKSFTDPRILPCFHTFCFKCIKEEVRGETHKNAISCPVCQSPAKTKVVAIPKNTYITRLMLAAKVLGLSPTLFSSGSVYRTRDYGCSNNTTRSRKLTTSKVRPETNSSNNGSELAQLQRRRECPRHPRQMLKLYCVDCSQRICHYQVCRVKHFKHSLMNAATDIDELLTMTNSYSIGVDACHACNAQDNLLKITREVGLNTASTLGRTNSASVSRIGFRSNRPKPANPRSSCRDRIFKISLEWERLNKRFYEEVTTKGFQSDICKTANDLCTNWSLLQEVSDRQSQKELSTQTWANESERERDSSRQLVKKNQFIQELLADREKSRADERQLKDTIKTLREEITRMEADFTANLQVHYLKYTELRKERDDLFVQMQANRRDTASGTHARPQRIAHRESRPNENEVKLVLENEEQRMRELTQLIFWIENIDAESVEFQKTTGRESENRMIKKLEASVSKKRKELIAKEKHFVNKIFELNQKINEQQVVLHELMHQQRTGISVAKNNYEELFIEKENAWVLIEKELTGTIHELESQTHQLRDDLKHQQSKSGKLEEALRKENLYLNAEMANLKQLLEQCTSDKKQLIIDKQREMENLLQWVDRIDKQPAYDQTTIEEESENSIIEKIKTSVMKIKNESRSKEKQLLKAIKEMTKPTQSLTNTNDANQHCLLIENEKLLKTCESQREKILKLERQICQMQEDLAQKQESNRILQEKLTASTTQENRIEESNGQIAKLQLRLQTERQTNEELFRNNREKMREILTEKERLWNTEEKELKDKIREMEGRIHQLQDELKQKIDSDKNFRDKLELAVTGDKTDVKKPLTLNRKETCNDSSAVQVAAYRRPNLRAPRGIQNLGNTCYFNAAIQNLYQTVLLNDELFSSIREQSSQNTNLECEPSLTIAYLEFLYNGYEDRSEEHFRHLIETFFKKSPRFADRGQHDSHDLLIHFLNCLRDEERRRHGSSKSAGFRNMLTGVDKVFGGHAITVYVCYACSTPYHVCEPFLDLSVPIVGPEDATKEEDQEEDMFINGHSADTKHHLTGNGIKRNDSRSRAVKATMEPLGVRPRSKERLFQKRSPNTKPLGRISLKQCLAYFCRIERIQDEYLCYQCQAIGQPPMTSASKRTLIYNPPAVLVLHLKRFEQTVSGFKKCNQRVTYDEYLDIGPYCSSSCLRLIEPDDASIWYSLYGVVVHMGSLTAGHYVSYIKVRDYDTLQSKKFLQLTFLNRDQVLNDDDIRRINASKGMHRSRKEWQPTEVDGRWFLVDDEDVRAVDKAEALSQEAYILFYERVAKPNDTVV